MNTITGYLTKAALYHFNSLSSDEMSKILFDHLSQDERNHLKSMGYVGCEL